MNKPEPLKDNIIRGVIVNADEYAEGIISKNKIVAEWIDVEKVKEKIAWLKDKLCLNRFYCITHTTRNKNTKNWKCRNCQIIDQAFLDITKR